MKKYLNKNERENLIALLCSHDIKTVRFGLDLLQSCSRYKYLKNKIIYRSKANKYPKIRVEQLINICNNCLNYNYVPFAATIIGYYVKTHEKVI